MKNSIYWYLVVYYRLFFDFSLEESVFGINMIYASQILNMILSFSWVGLIIIIGRVFYIGFLISVFVNIIDYIKE